MKLLLPLLVFFLADVYCQESQHNEVLKGGVTVMTEQCGNELNKVWVDVFFLVDRSKSMTRNGFIDKLILTRSDVSNSFFDFSYKNMVIKMCLKVLGEIATSMEELTIGQDMHEPVTRAGLITYGEDAKLVWDLDHWKSQDHMQEELGVMIDNARKNYIQTEGTNILA
ncbi:hypothetical protein ANCCAN_03755 [Ancylostoma caninum]|uniref:VWFA domain-containing protein n=1 Tax=Ancylostoma caninum TaxID=29170 RepID=A0A368H4E6_ANCCA|nr:hypothetical protein ANCCAN_03755 [Ancylostoma caninum]